MESVLSSPRPLNYLPHASALDWLGLLLDVHFAQLSLVPEARHTLVALQRQVNTQVSRGSCGSLQTTGTMWPVPTYIAGGYAPPEPLAVVVLVGGHQHVTAGV